MLQAFANSSRTCRNHPSISNSIKVQRFSAASLYARGVAFTASRPQQFEVPAYALVSPARRLATPCTIRVQWNNTRRLWRVSQPISVKAYYELKEKLRIYHGVTSSTRQSTLKRNLVDASTLSHVLKVDTEKRTCLIEPNVSMDRLVEETLQYGLILPVVIEFPGITVGGGYSGTSGESSSFKHGFFDKTINYVEMVLANGDVVKISPTENADLPRCSWCSRDFWCSL